ncbi:unnamed protein product [Didymodactylos carnosus]|uniref:Uncharacterized protein n=1 Tax=Didymodactylos carnosus TaxID=1234261 RepID=A0A814RZ74_9BILA|nr:unnamed protein product [Didymodactylos carnosus]CAF1139320.1 unnamed protein product [Didymodactylos carnosus]CAF3740211.1 unnamed protein product [Didymodactylos carnosus]CAF3903028.1 unnamed protein product [Didymodactylos carnosus]
MSNKTRELKETKPKRDTSTAAKSTRTVLAAPTSAKGILKKTEPTTMATKMTTSGGTSLDSSTVAASVFKQHAPMITPLVTTMSTADVSESSTLAANAKSPICRVSLYALRYFIDSDKLKLQAVFGPKLALDFEEIVRLPNDKEQAYVPFVFQLSANVQIDVDGIPYVVTKKARYRCTEYYLRVEKSALFFQSSKCDEIARRSMSNNRSSHQFLLDLRFPDDRDNALFGKFFRYFIAYGDRYLCLALQKHF